MSAKGKGAFFVDSMDRVWYTHLDRPGFFILVQQQEKQPQVAEKQTEVGGKDEA